MDHPDLVFALVNVLALVFFDLDPLLGFALYGWTWARRSWQSMGFKRPMIGPYLLGFIPGPAALACLIRPAEPALGTCERPLVVTLLYLARLPWFRG